MRRAARTDSNHSQIRDLLRSLLPIVEDTSRFGDGWPDLIVHLRDGTVKFVEIKDGRLPPSARRLTPAEQAFAARWGKAYVVVTSVDEAIALAQTGRIG
jgi:hypothetical protein